MRARWRMMAVEGDDPDDEVDNVEDVVAGEGLDAAAAQQVNDAPLPRGYPRSAQQAAAAAAARELEQEDHSDDDPDKVILRPGHIIVAKCTDYNEGWGFFEVHRQYTVSQLRTAGFAPFSRRIVGLWLEDPHDIVDDEPEGPIPAGGDKHFRRWWDPSRSRNRPAAARLSDIAVESMCRGQGGRAWFTIVAPRLQVAAGTEYIVISKYVLEQGKSIFRVNDAPAASEEDDDPVERPPRRRAQSRQRRAPAPASQRPSRRRRRDEQSDAEVGESDSSDSSLVGEAPRSDDADAHVARVNKRARVPNSSSSSSRIARADRGR